ncbi:3D domain-containing protein [Dehalobacterium formicoaceticum]|uniref:3D domain-containing protein n=1 Tax=Dehalobacterium formicoaceticum TaxID=51515 RepID=A0ABT1Y3T8_9FIRM|nr:3D domain-containing protein [Dehalobacterium formicoaceticum]MCR6545228.1 3D domain-containing protein [Dehalobacterium formicoaceticum]
MENASAQLGHPRWVKFASLSLVAVLLIIMGYAAYAVMEKEVVIVDDGVRTEARTFKADVTDLLAERNIKINPEDLVQPGMTTQLKEGQVIEITRAFPVVIKADGKETKVLTTPMKVEEVLAKANINIESKDLVQPALSQLVQKETPIVINRIKEELITKKQALAYQVEKKNDASLERGKRRVVQKGQNGVREDTIKVTYQDGQKIAHKVVETKTIKKPVNEVIAQGTMQLASRGGSTERGGDRFDYSKSLRVSASAYTHTGNRTKTGTSPKVGTIAVDPSVIPLGSKLYVEGYGYGRAEDVGGAIKGNRVDLFMPTEQQCLNWGRKSVQVYVLN